MSDPFDDIIYKPPGPLYGDYFLNKNNIDISEPALREASRQIKNDLRNEMDKEKWKVTIDIDGDIKEFAGLGEEISYATCTHFTPDDYKKSLVQKIQIVSDLINDRTLSSIPQPSSDIGELEPMIKG